MCQNSAAENTVAQIFRSAAVVHPKLT